MSTSSVSATEAASAPETPTPNPATSAANTTTTNTSTPNPMTTTARTTATPNPMTTTLIERSDAATLRKICLTVNPPGRKRQGFHRGGSITIPCLLPEHPFDEIEPRILLGDQFLGRDPDRCAREGVTHVLNAAQGKKFGSVDTSAEEFEPKGIQFLGIAANDVLGYNLSAHFPTAIEFIKKALESHENNKVYIHCVQGISRSTTLLAAYFMTVKGQTATEALTSIRQRREVFPNEGFLKQLCQLEETLRSEGKYGE